MHWLLIIPVIPYLILLTYFSARMPGRIFRKGKNNPSVKITVIIPCRNEEKMLPGILRTISEQDYPKDLTEVIVADDYSEDSTSPLAKSYSGQLNIKVVTAAEKGKKAAIMNAVNSATGGIIVTTDADCKAGRSWLSTIASFSESSGADMILCPVKLEGGRGVFSEMQRLEFLSLQGITAASAGSGNAVMCNGANLAFRKNIYLRNSHALHSEIASGDDIFLLHAVKNENGKILWLNSPEAAVSTLPAPGLREFLNQRARWISKAGSITDKFTNLTAIVTFVTISSLVYLSLTALSNPENLRVYLVCLGLKCIPDYLILRQACTFHNEKGVLKWFIPVQLLYQWYVMAVIIRSLFENRWKNEKI